MGRITTDVGLFTGFPIKETVDKLVEISSRRRDLLLAANDKREAQQLGITTLSAQLIGLQISARKLGNINLFDKKVATASDAALSVSITGQPALGNYQVTPLQTAQAHQLLSNGIASRTAPVGAGKVSFRFGGFLDANTSLDLLNGGEGFRRGRIRVTDRLGNSADIDLRYARTIDDVLRAVNGNADIDVRAEVVGDAIRLIDNTGATVSNLKVRDLDSSGTAASLGLAGTDVAASQTTGQDIVRLFNGLALDQLNDGLGVRFDDLLADLRVTLRDNGDPIDIDFQRPGTSVSQISATTPGSNSVHAKLKFQAREAQQNLVGVTVSFVADSAVTAGNETVEYDADDKTLIFKIDEGQTTANQIVAALGKNSAASALFDASLVAGSNGTGTLSTADTVTLDGPRSSALSSGTLGVNSRLELRAKQSSPDTDGFELILQDNGGVTQGNEQVSFDLNAKTVTVQIAAGASTANDVIAQLNADSSFAALFDAQLASGSTGAGIVSSADTAITAGGAVITKTSERTLGDVIQTINATAPTRLRAQLSASGDALELIDLSVNNGGSFTVTSLNDSHAAEDLGLDADASADTITTRRLLAGLGSVLLHTINGGAGFDNLGEIDLTDRSGAQATVDLAGAQSVHDIIERINSAGIGIRAALNSSRNGLSLTDTTGATASNLIVANGDGTNTAEQLGLAASVADTSVNSGNLRRQTVNENTKLSSLNNGAGIADGDFRILDTTGASRTFTFLNSQLTTVGDLLREINGLGLAVEAQINDAGDGIQLVDTAHGTSTLSVETGRGTTAADLHLLRTAVSRDIGGQPTSVVDGSTTFEVTLDSDDSLNDLVNKLNTLGAGVSAAVVNDGTLSAPFRLSLQSNRTGARGEILVDASALGITFQETARARDAVLLIGGGENPAAGILATSTTNTFQDAVAGLTFTVNKSTTASVNVNVAPNDADVVAAVQDVVDRYNAIQGNIRLLGDPDKGILARSSVLLRLQSDLSDLVTRRILGAGTINLLSKAGISTFTPEIDPATAGITEEDLAQMGNLVFDPDQLKQTFATDRLALREFFTTLNTGVAARFDSTIHQLAASQTSALLTRQTALATQIAQTEQEITDMNEQLEKTRTRLTNAFIRSEEAIAKLNSNLGALQTLSQLAGQV
jgi:flagellar hook-associated protein 2